jgi:hypothetical protein
VAFSTSSPPNPKPTTFVPPPRKGAPLLPGGEEQGWRGLQMGGEGCRTEERSGDGEPQVALPTRRSASSPILTDAVGELGENSESVQHNE